MGQHLLWLYVGLLYPWALKLDTLPPPPATDTHTHRLFPPNYSELTEIQVQLSVHHCPDTHVKRHWVSHQYATFHFDGVVNSSGVDTFGQGRNPIFHQNGTTHMQGNQAYLDIFWSCLCMYIVHLSTPTPVQHDLRNMEKKNHFQAWRY